MINNNELKSYEELQGECAPVFYKEVEKFFAKGMLVLVATNLDIIKVALAIAADDTEQIQQWISAEQVVRVHDEFAKKWSENNETLMAITAVPWVLVQEINEQN
ncbi:MAG TPA: DUF2288 family protein [Oceanospirillales bacterium]|nr:DUF2288 family protein [Oceanospirillales bacterium]